MDWAPVFELLGKCISTVAAIGGGWWAIEKWRRREEHFPRIYFEVSANFLGLKDDHIVTELIATLENKGVVPLKIKSFTFQLRGLKISDPIEQGGPECRGQLLFAHVLGEGRFISESWAYSFIYPGLQTEYNYVIAIPADVSHIRMAGNFEYLMNGETHHAAKVLSVPAFR